MENSSLPSTKLGTHSVITAHRGLPSSKLFRDLDKVGIGDQFYIQVLDEVWAESKLNEGSIFTIALPVYNAINVRLLSKC